METTVSNTPETTQQKREHLKELSAQVKPLVEKGKFEKLNQAIIETFYRDDINQEFKTFWQWVDCGYRVKKGSKAFYVWAKPLSAQAQAKGETWDEETRDFYPLCFLFSNAQVEPIKKAKS